MEIRIFNNYQDLSKHAALEIIKQIKAKPDSILGFATGSSPVGLYQELISDYKKNHTSYKQVTSFNLDEYFGIDDTHEQSYYHFMMENLFNHIDIRKDHIHIPSGDTEDIEHECRLYNKKLEKQPIDIQILGIGSNGHIGFNEPGTPLNSKTHYVKLDEKTRIDNARFFDSLEDVPTHAVTMGIKNILDAKKIILIATGLKKADAVYKMVHGPLTTKTPASALQKHNQVILFLDEAAASKLAPQKLKGVI